MQKPEYQKIIKDVFERRKSRNRAYSLRAFAKSIEVDAGTVSRVLNGKQVPSYKLALKIASALKLAEAEENEFLDSIKKTQTDMATSIAPRNFLFTKPRNAVEKTDAAIYDVMSRWYHTAILEFSEIKNHQVTPQAVASTFSITLPEAEKALIQLEALGLLEIKNGRITKKNAYLSTKNKSKTTAALRENQRQFLTKAIESLTEDPIDKRSMTSVVMAVDPKRIAVAKRMISDFNKALCHYLEQGERTEVYNLSIALHPLQKNQ